MNFKKIFSLAFFAASVVFSVSAWGMQIINAECYSYTGVGGRYSTIQNARTDGMSLRVYIDDNTPCYIKAGNTMKYVPYDDEDIRLVPFTNTYDPETDLNGGKAACDLMGACRKFSVFFHPFTFDYILEHKGNTDPYVLNRTNDRAAHGYGSIIFID